MRFRCVRTCVLFGSWVVLLVLGLQDLRGLDFSVGLRARHLSLLKVEGFRVAGLSFAELEVYVHARTNTTDIKRLRLYG